MSRPVNSLDNIRSNATREEESGCLLYMGALDQNGYPKISYQGRIRLGSHVVFELYFGVIPVGHEVDHICHVRRCIEPTHLRALTHRENVIHSKVYMDKRHQRIKQLIETYPQIRQFPLLISLAHLNALWDCGSTAQVKARLKTMSKALPDAFCYEQFAAGQGSQPHLYAIGIQPSLIDKLLHGDQQPVPPAVDIMPLVA
jgi:hypothetical protein